MSDPNQLPEANFLSFCSGMATQALMQLGKYHFQVLVNARKTCLMRGTPPRFLKFARKTDATLTSEERSYLDAAIEDLTNRLQAKGA